MLLNARSRRKILLDQRHDGPIENRRQSKRHDDRDDGLTFRCVREQRNAQPDEPNVPSFSPASTTAMPIGPSRRASGSQVWKGNTGALNAKPRNNSQKMRICWLSGIGRRAGPTSQTSRSARYGAGRPLVIIDVQEGDAHQHEDTTKQGVEHEFQCCVVPLPLLHPRA